MSASSTSDTASAGRKKMDTLKTCKLHYEDNTWIVKFPRIPRVDKSSTLYLQLVKSLFLQKARQENIWSPEIEEKINNAPPPTPDLNATGEKPKAASDFEKWFPWVQVCYKDTDSLYIHISDEEELALAFEDWTETNVSTSSTASSGAASSSKRSTHNSTANATTASNNTTGLPMNFYFTLAPQIQ